MGWPTAAGGPAAVRSPLNILAGSRDTLVGTYQAGHGLPVDHPISPGSFPESGRRNGHQERFPDVGGGFDSLRLLE